MSGVFGLTGPTESVVGFVQRRPHEDAARVAAVAVWRHRPHLVAPQPAGEALRRLFSRRIRTPTPDHPRPRLPQGWEAASDLGGARETLLSGRRRLLRVAGAELPLCDDGRTLVALVDARADGAPTVGTHVMDLAPPPAVHMSPWRMLADHLRARLRGAPDPSIHDVVYPQLFGDPVVAAFLALRT